MSSTAIADHALLSDRHSSALVDRAGSVEWLGFPRFDSPSVFGRLLGPDCRPLADRAGRPGDQPPAAMSTATLVLETTFQTPSGERRAHRPARRAARTTAGIGWAPAYRICWSAGWPAPRDRSRWTSHTPRAPSTGWSYPLLAHVEGGVTARGGGRVAGADQPCRPRARGRNGPGRIALQAGADRPPRSAPLDPGADPGPDLVALELAARSSTRRCGLAVVVRPAPGLRRAVA